jgi:hypothetical protein
MRRARTDGSSLAGGAHTFLPLSLALPAAATDGDRDGRPLALALALRKVLKALLTLGLRRLPFRLADEEIGPSGRGLLGVLLLQLPTPPRPVVWLASRTGFLGGVGGCIPCKREGPKDWGVSASVLLLGSNQRPRSMVRTFSYAANSS